MKMGQQKQADSDGEFEQTKAIIQTVAHTTLTTPKPPKSSHPRTKYLSQKQKLGLLISPISTQPLYAPSAKASPVPHGKIIKIGTATFRSNFDSGSLGSVELIGVNSYRIELQQQTNSSRTNTWFYFSVEGLKGEALFTINGFTKKSSLYNQGMKICYRDNKQANKWKRGGLRIRYEPYEVEEGDRYFCLKFAYFFKANEYSCVEFAYSFPYELSKLNQLIAQLQPKVKAHSLGLSYEGRTIPLLTLGNPSSKELVIISGRVHPGQTGSSFIVEGFLKQLISDSEQAYFLRERFLFKVVPMINVDGVARGNYRFSAAGADLNRKWKQPSGQYHPEIYMLKEMIMRQNKTRKLRMYIDLHGHSRKRNVFFYGCCPGSKDEDDYSRAKAFPYLMSKIHSVFSYQDCSFNVQKDKEGTARVTLFRELKIHQIFTLEASFCGPAVGPNFAEVDYQKIGRKLCEGISLYFRQPNSNNIASESKLLAMKQQFLSELTSSSYLLDIGNQYNSGSQSEPEKGQTIPKPTKASKTDSKKQPKTPHFLRYNSKMQSSFKQKSQAAVVQQKEFKQGELYMYLLEAPTQTIEADFSKQPLVPAKNQRMHSTSKQSNYRTRVKVPSQHQQQTIISLQERSNDKTKVNLLIGRQGAQYRRVRKMAQMSMKQDRIEISSVEIKGVRGVRGSKIQLQNGIKMMPKLCVQAQPNKHRRTSAEMFYKKPQKLQMGAQMDMKVLCRGRQIFF